LTSDFEVNTGSVSRSVGMSTMIVYCVNHLGFVSGGVAMSIEFFAPPYNISYPIVCVPPNCANLDYLNDNIQ
jgi:hypothetical protein